MIYPSYYKCSCFTQQVDSTWPMLWPRLCYGRGNVIAKVKPMWLALRVISQLPNYAMFHMPKYSRANAYTQITRHRVQIRPCFFFGGGGGRVCVREEADIMRCNLNREIIYININLFVCLFASCHGNFWGHMEAVIMMIIRMRSVIYRDKTV